MRGKKMPRQRLCHSHRKEKLLKRRRLQIIEQKAKRKSDQPNAKKGVSNMNEKRFEETKKCANCDPNPINSQPSTTKKINNLQLVERRDGGKHCMDRENSKKNDHGGPQSVPLSVINLS